MKRSRNVFTREFKQECVNLVPEQGYDLAKAASAMSVGKPSLQKWISQYRKERQGITPKASAITPEQLRIQSLEAENRQLKKDNDLLKKSSAFFAIEMQSAKK